jgi:hypothetical protein
MKTSNKRRLLVKVLLIAITIFTILPFSTYLISYQAKPRSQLIFEESRSFDQYYGFVQEDSSVGIIYYPGGLVHPSAYASFAKELSLTTQYSVFVTIPLFHLAITQIDLADKVINQHPEILTWLIGGHSLGGTTAAFYAIDHLQSVQGLFFLASYTTAQADFSLTSLPVLSIIASEDLVLNESTYLTHQQYLPANHLEMTIEGGNHSQFADYGLQRGDGPPLIDPIQQETMVIQILANWFDSIILN